MTDSTDIENCVALSGTNQMNPRSSTAFERATDLAANQLAMFLRGDGVKPNENDRLMAGHIVGNLWANDLLNTAGEKAVEERGPSDAALKEQRSSPNPSGGWPSEEEIARTILSLWQARWDLPYLETLASDAARAVLSSLPRPPSGWRDIESAPKDGTRLLLWNVWEAGRSYMVVGSWRNYLGPHKFDWRTDSGAMIVPAFWQPLPAPPEAAVSSEIEVTGSDWKKRKISCTALAEWIAEQATGDRVGLIQRVAEAIQEDRKAAVARARGAQ